MHDVCYLCVHGLRLPVWALDFAFLRQESTKLVGIGCRVGARFAPGEICCFTTDDAVNKNMLQMPRGVQQNEPRYSRHVGASASKHSRYPMKCSLFITWKEFFQNMSLTPKVVPE